MKEHPIIFGPEIIRAILDGRCTMIRRVIKPQPPRYWSIPPARFSKGYFCEWGNPNDKESIKCPYGQVGDRLWVRETHYIDYPLADGVLRAIFKDGSEKFTTGEYISEFCNVKGLKWRPSLYMPRWASRILLEITEVRVERLQEINEGDCYKEGIADFRSNFPDIAKVHRPIHSFQQLWDSLNAKRGYGWETNPWVWVIGFKVIKGGLNADS